MLTPAVQEFISSATAKALATYAGEINVVPVSVVEINPDTLFLFDFFMQKTVENITQSSAVAFTCWNGLLGIQIKGSAVYLSSGEVYQSAVLRMQEQFPDRTLRGVIVITPTKLYDVSVAGKVLV